MTFLNQLIATAGTSLAIPIDWRIDANLVECVGPGGSGAVQHDTGTPFYSGFSGGGGAYAASPNVNVAPGAPQTIQVGAGVDACFGGSTLGTCLVGAQKGGNGTTGNPFAGPGGLASASVGVTKFNGGNGALGGTSIGGCASGGGAAGPNGAGGNGAGAGANTGVTGGTADNGTVAGGVPGGNGNSGTEFDASHGCGSGAGSSSAGVISGSGGSFGGGAGANSQFGGTSAGTGAPGLISAKYVPMDLGALFLI